jgi:hypothetical protein
LSKGKKIFTLVKVNPIIMKKLVLATFFICRNHSKCSRQQRTIKISNVEAACGQCQFEMEGYGCELAVRIDGKPYFVDGTPLIPMVMHMLMMVLRRY